MDKKLFILFVPMNTLGHLNPMIGFAQMLHPKHHIIFAVSQKSKGVPSYYGFQEEVYEVDNPFFNVDKKEMKKINEEKKIFGNNNGMQRWKLMVDEEVLLNMTKSVNPKVKQVVDKIQPDLVVVDVAFCIPSAIRNYPWIHLITSNPSMVMLDERCPPPGLGLSTTDSSMWKQNYEELKTILISYIRKYND